MSGVSKQERASKVAALRLQRPDCRSKMCVPVGNLKHGGVQRTLGKSYGRQNCCIGMFTIHVRNSETLIYGVSKQKGARILGPFVSIRLVWIFKKRRMNSWVMACLSNLGGHDIHVDREQAALPDRVHDDVHHCGAVTGGYR